MTIFFLIGYFAGSIPFGLILTKLAGLGDIRNIGSGNIGATNVLRTGNKKLAIATLLLDALKGVVPILLLVSVTLQYVAQEDYSVLALKIGIGAVLGHMFPIWLKFKGGKGVAVALGVLLAATPWVGVIVCFIWIISAFIFRISSLAALLGFLFAPLITLFIYGLESAGLALIISILIFFRHKDNIKRLLKGEEPKIGKKKRS